MVIGQNYPFEIVTKQNNTVMLSNCTFAGNSATVVNGLVVYYSGGRQNLSDIRLDNCVFWDGGVEIVNNDGSAITVTYTDVQGGQNAIHDPLRGVSWCAGNIDIDPCFADPGYWDPCNTPDDPNDNFWVDGDYHLKSQAGRWDPNTQSWVKDDVTSPCIDAGDPMSPIGLEPFPNGGRINIGAYGGTAEASKSYFGEPLCETVVAGDINGDCKVNLADFAIVALHWLEDAHVP